jgi:indole-3-glycerol phosphate synthase
VVSGALPDVLARIVAKRRERYGLAADGPASSPFPGSPSPSPSSRSSAEEPSSRSPSAVSRLQGNRFLEVLRARATAGGRAAIAEVKLGSPRLASLAGRIDPERQAELYASAGAACLSVVVEPDFFQGSFFLLERCARASGLPAIAKDFVVCERQLDEAAEAGAEAILLIAALYSREALAAWAAAARLRGLAPLVETHDDGDLALLAGSDWEMVGVNNRDLRTFEVDLDRSIAMAPKLPAGALRVAESGIAARADVDRLGAAGFDAFLVGESLLVADDPAAKLRELFG